MRILDVYLHDQIVVMSLKTAKAGASNMKPISRGVSQASPFYPFPFQRSENL